MRTLTSKLKIFASVVAAVLMIGATTSFASAVTPDVVFNNGSGVVGIGEEMNFLRIGDANGANTTEACTEGQTVDLWFYVHNTNPSELNGANYDSDTVAKNTKVDIDFANSGFVNNHEIVASVKADNSALAVDNAYITCQGKAISLEFASQSMTTNAPAYTTPYTLTGSIMDHATLGYAGKVPGCFDFRAFIKVRVKVHVKPEIVKPTCDLLEVVKSGKTVTVKKINYTANSATVDNVAVDFGDGTNKVLSFSQLPFSYTYANESNYTVRATLKTSLGDTTSNSCVISIKPDQLPNTGAGSTIAIFIGTTFIGAFLYRNRAIRSLR